MFLTLARYPELQDHFNKIVSLSGILDLELQMETRPDMKEMFQNVFGIKPGFNDKDWINRRNPLLTVPFIKKDLPILIIQGAKDIRINLEEGHHMMQKLQEHGNNVSYLEVPDGSHTLYGMKDRTK